jgi:peptidoglycan/xylan/chitin deacetylase (PgdA/CDA1 family)
MKRFSPFRWLAPAGAGGRLSIFIFHRVLAQPDPLRPSEPDVPRFDRIVEFLVRYFQVLPLSHALRALQEDGLPAGAACITFDDGYADNLLLAAPVLRRHGASATVFVATGFSGGGRMFNDSVIEAVRALSGDADWREFGLGQHRIDDDAGRLELIGKTLIDLKYRAPKERAEIAMELARRAGLGRTSDLMLTPLQLIDWRNRRLEVGGHTVNHPILARLAEAEAYEEIAAGRDQLAQWLGAAPETFAYPNGMPGRDYGPRDVELVKRAGYGAAVSTSRGAAARGVDLYQLPRFTPWDRSMWRFGLRCAETLVKTRRWVRRAADESNNNEVRT